MEGRIRKWQRYSITVQVEEKSVARCRLVPGNGTITINNRTIDDYFGLETLKVICRQPLVLTDTREV